MPSVTSFALVFVMAPATYGHHSIGVTFDIEQLVEIEGEVTRILWRNPHIRLTVRTPEGGGQAATDWTIEGGAVSRLSRWGVPEGVFELGDSITLAGFPSRRRGNELYGQNLLLPDGREVLLDHRSSPRWTENPIGGERMSAGASSSSLGIFRVWTSDGQSYDLDTDNFPLTDSARAAQSAWDRVQDNPYFGCMPKGMPTIMQQPFPIEFVDRGADIHMRIEEYDLVRLISMTGYESNNLSPPTILGSSRGRWEGETLTVTTSNLSWPYSFGQIGIPQSASVRLTERFTIVDDGSRLEYEVTSDDPDTFTVPLTLTKSYLWVPGLELLPYECTEN